MSEQPQGNAPPGWYPDASGRQRWWDGSEWGQVAPGSAAPPPAGQPAGAAATTGTDPKTLAMLAQLLGIFTGFLGPLIIYLVNGEKDPYVRHHSAEALNFQITLFIAYAISAVLIIVLIGLLLLPAVWIASLVFMIQATIAANRGEWYRYPINLRLVPGAVG
jgi:uncharacterized Tic20 family protein